MAVKIRLKRMGKKKQPSYRVVVADSRAPRDGRIIESIGRYDPRQEPSLVEIDNERAQYWLGNGAQPTERAQKLLEISGAVAASKVSRSGVYHLEKEDVPPVSDEVVGEATTAESPVEEVPAQQAPDEPDAAGVATDEAPATDEGLSTDEGAVAAENADAEGEEV